MSANGSHPDIAVEDIMADDQERDATAAARFHEAMGVLHEVRDDVQETKKEVQGIKTEQIKHDQRLTSLEKLVTVTAIIGGSAPWLVELAKWLYSLAKG